MDKAYIEKNTFQGAGAFCNRFYIELPSGFVAHIDKASTLEEAVKEAKKRYLDRVKRYNHAYTIAFSIDTDHEDKDVTADELLEGLENRLKNLRQHKAEILEAVGAAFDTYENDDYEEPE